MNVSCLAGRTEFAPAGVLGGGPGGMRAIAINGKTVHPKGRYVLQPGDRIDTVEAGGGGYGDPRKRSRAALDADLRQGFVTHRAARRDYGLATERNRSSLRCDGEARQRAALHGQQHAGKEGGARRGEKGDRLGHVLGPPDASSGCSHRVP